MYSNHTIIIDKGECREDYVCHILRDLMLDQSSNSNNFIEKQRMTGTQDNKS